MVAISGAELPKLLESWLITLRAEKKAKSTQRVYRLAVEGFLADYPELTKANVVLWMADQSDAETASIRVRLQALKQFAKWLAAETGFEADHITVLRPPKLHQKPVASLTDAEIAGIIKTCVGHTFQAKRDKALLLLFAETGLRAAEMLALDVTDVNVTTCTALVRKGKGGDYRRVKFSTQAAVELDRYLRARRIQGFDAGPLWIGKSRPLDYKGMVASLKKRARAAGVDGFHVHRLRHSMAVRWIRSSGSEGGLMAQAGWKSRDMIDRYVKTAAEELAAEEFDRLSMGFNG